MERGEFNILTIKTNDYQFWLKKYLLKKEQDLESIVAHLNNLNFGEENFNKKNKKKIKIKMFEIFIYIWFRNLINLFYFKIY